MRTNKNEQLNLIQESVNVGERSVNVEERLENSTRAHWQSQHKRKKKQTHYEE
jgi:hypothetical protein